jgi:hypothetical protein
MDEYPAMNIFNRYFLHSLIRLQRYTNFFGYIIFKNFFQLLFYSVYKKQYRVSINIRYFSLCFSSFHLSKRLFVFIEIYLIALELFFYAKILNDIISVLYFLRSGFVYCVQYKLASLHPVGNASLGRKTCRNTTLHPVRDASFLSFFHCAFLSFCIVGENLFERKKTEKNVVCN